MKPVKRRKFLQSATTMGIGLAGCTDFVDTGTDQEERPEADAANSQPATETERTSESDPESVLPEGVPAVPGGFSEVVDVVEAGADADGEEPINEVLFQNLDAGTLLSFPAGQYEVEPFELEGLENVGMIAESDAEVSLVPSVPANEIDDEWIHLSAVRGFLIDGLHLDFRQEGYSGRVMITGQGDFAIRNVQVDGRYSIETDMAFRFDLRHPDHSALIENLAISGIERSEGETTGIYVGRHHAGKLTFRDCSVENFPDNGLYASAPGGHGGSFEAEDGIVHVDGGVYRNNNIANVRLGSTGSTMRDVAIVVDDVPPEHPNGLNVRGIRLRGKNDQLIENCTIQFGPDAGSGTGAIAINRDNGNATIRDSRIEMDRDDMRAISVAEPSEAALADQTDPVGVHFERVRIVGSAAEGTAAVVVGRDRTEFRSCQIYQNGANRGGVSFRYSDDCLVRDTTLAVTAEPIIRYESTVREENVTFGFSSNSDR